MSTLDDPNGRGPVRAHRLVVAGVLALALVAGWVAFDWDIGPGSFTEDWSAPAAVEDGGWHGDPLVALDEVDPDADPPGPESISLDEFVYAHPEDPHDNPSWAAAFTNTGSEHFAGFTLRLTFTSESGDEFVHDHPIGHRAATALRPGQSSAYGGTPFLGFETGDDLDADVPVEAEIVDPRWYTPAPGSEQDLTDPVSFETVSSVTDADGQYIYITVEVTNPLDTAYSSGGVAVLYDQDGDMVGGAGTAALKRHRSAPPGTSEQTFVMEYQVFEDAGADLDRIELFARDDLALD